MRVLQIEKFSRNFINLDKTELKSISRIIKFLHLETWGLNDGNRMLYRSNGKLSLILKHF